MSKCHACVGWVVLRILKDPKIKLSPELLMAYQNIRSCRRYFSVKNILKQDQGTQ